jgi:hypothetical protein
MLTRILLFLLPTATIALVLFDHGNPELNPTVQESGSHDAEKVLLCHSRSECL